jgi:hypothetical protein
MRPFRSPIFVTVACALRRRDEDQPGKAEHVHERDERTAFSRHLNRVVVEPRHDVRAAADERLQRLRAAGVVLELDVEPFFLVVPELLGERRRQVDELILAAHGQPDVGSA